MRLDFEGRGPASRWAYRIAGRILDSALELPHLNGYLTRSQTPDDEHEFPAPGAPSQEIFSGPAFVGGRDRHLLCERAGPLATLSIEGLGRYRLDLAGGAIMLLPPFPDPALVEQALCGPGLALVLAHGGDFLLHASAVKTASGVVALIGRSGAGKSTLAAELTSGGAASPVADDAVPVRLGTEDIVVAGTFPQPKWPQWGAGCHAELPARLTDVVELVPDGTAPRLERLPASEALLTAASHTVAARLFDAGLLERHFRFGHELVSRAAWWRLRYAPDLRNLSTMVDHLRQLFTRSV